MRTVFTIIIAIIVFGVLIFIHEFGHYITARIFKVTIKEFSIGMGPRIFTRVSKKTKIRYSVSAFPIGGFVSMAGEDGAEDADEKKKSENSDTAQDTQTEDDGEGSQEEQQSADDPNSFDKKPAWQRFIITFAGAFINITAGFLAVIIVTAMMRKLPSTTVDIHYTDEVIENNSLSFEVQSDEYLRSGDTILRVNGKRVSIYEELRYEIMRNGHKPIDVLVLRDGEQVLLEDVVFPVVENQGQVFGTIDFFVEAKNKNFFTVIGDSWQNMWLTVRMCWESIFDLITGRYTFAAVSGPVGISAAIGQAAGAGFIALLNMIALISINLGVMNLLPIPALDGGRLITILIEMITKKKLPPKVEKTINTVGLSVLLAFSAVVLIKDIVQLIIS